MESSGSLEPLARARYEATTVERPPEIQVNISRKGQVENAYQGW